MPDAALFRGYVLLITTTEQMDVFGLWILCSQGTLAHRGNSKGEIGIVTCNSHLLNRSAFNEGASNK